MVLYLVACLAVEVTEVSLAFLAAACMVAVAYLGLEAMVDKDMAATVVLVGLVGVYVTCCAVSVQGAPCYDT